MRDCGKRSGMVGRPRIELDERQIVELAKLQCSNEEIASVMGVSADTIVNNFSEAISRGREMGKVSLRKAQWDKAVKDGNPQMLVWLGRFYLRQREEISFSSSESDVRALLSQWEVTAKRRSYFDRGRQQKTVTIGEKF